MDIVAKYNQRVDQANSLLCVGLDSDLSKLPEKFKNLANPQFEFNKYIIEQTYEYVSAYKPNIAFYEARGGRGLEELKMTMDYLNQYHPDIFTICDAKRGDIGNTNEQYATEVFDWLGADSITLQPYFGREAIEPFLKRKDKISIILVRTSNPGGKEIQDLFVGDKAIWEIIAEKVQDEWNEYGNCMVVFGAPYPEELTRAREILTEMTFLVPGVGAQGGEVEATVRAGLDARGRGMIINASRAVIFAANPSGEAKKLRDEINKYR